MGHRQATSRPPETQSSESPRNPVRFNDVAIAASPEWFGDGRKACREILVRRERAELLAAASPGDFRVNEVE